MQGFVWSQWIKFQDWEPDVSTSLTGNSNLGGKYRKTNYWSKAEWRFHKSNVVKLHYMNFNNKVFEYTLVRFVSDQSLRKIYQYWVECARNHVKNCTCKFLHAKWQNYLLFSYYANNTWRSGIWRTQPHHKFRFGWAKIRLA